MKERAELRENNMKLKNNMLKMFQKKVKTRVNKIYDS